MLKFIIKVDPLWPEWWFPLCRNCGFPIPDRWWRNPRNLHAYAGPYSSREAYNWTATTSIYVDKDYRRQGIGSLLYKELEKRLKEQDIVNLLAGAAYSDEEDEYLTHDSYKFHIRSGYTKVAHMKTIGKKFDRWYDLLWMQKKL